MELFLYDFEGNELGTADKIISSYRNLCFNGIGSSEFHIDTQDPLACIIAENDYLILEQDGVFQDIVVGHKTEEDFTIYCRSLSWLLSKMIVPPQSLSGSAKALAQTLLKSSYGCAVSLGNVADLSASSSFESNRVTLLSDSLKNCLDLVNGGHSVRFSHEDKKFYLDILKGENMDLYLCEDEETLESFTTEKDLLDLSNSFSYQMHFPVISTWNVYNNSPSLVNNKASNFGRCYRVTNAGDGVTRFGYTWENGDYIYCKNEDGKWKKSLSVPDPIYVYVPDTTVSDKYKWFSISSGSTKEEGRASLSELIIKRKFSVTPKNILFSRDYRLGDFVTVQYKTNGKIKTSLCQVTDIVLSRDNLKTIENPTLKEV
ncbi:MAG: hypothetical protein IKC07_02145 [Clostridia bacterium]|nr:hypothetical protein [Clostridia bacterium]